MRPVRRAKTWIIGLEWVLCGRRRAERSNPTSKVWLLRRRMRAERSYSMFKARRGGREYTPHPR